MFIKYGLKHMNTNFFIYAQKKREQEQEII